MDGGSVVDDRGMPGGEVETVPADRDGDRALIRGDGALVGDLLRSPSDAGRATAFLVLGGNTFGLLAPIVTGYVVDATGLQRRARH